MSAATNHSYTIKKVVLELKAQEKDLRQDAERLPLARIELEPGMYELLPKEGEVIELPLAANTLPDLGIRESACIDPAMLSAQQAQWWRVRKVTKFYNWFEGNLEVRVICEASNQMF